MNHHSPIYKDLFTQSSPKYLPFLDLLLPPTMMPYPLARTAGGVQVHPHL